MNPVAILIERIRDTQRQLHLIKQHLRDDPSDVMLQLTLQSMERVALDLREQYRESAREAHVSLCDYRIFDDLNPRDVFPVLSLTDTVGGFQRAFTAVYDALTSGKKRLRSRPSSVVIERTAMGFGYSFTGSLGVTMTLPEDVTLFDAEILQRTVDTLFEIARAETSEQVAAFAAVLGPAPVRAVYRWAQGHENTGTGLEIDWYNPAAERRSLVLNRNQTFNLSRTIEESSDTHVEMGVITGLLVGLQAEHGRFWMEIADESTISGRMDARVLEAGPVTVPARYEAHVQRSTSVNFATGSEDVEYLLLGLLPVESSEEST
jgi:hypothetical protein